MLFIPKVWKDTSETKITAASLVDMEERLSDYTDAAVDGFPNMQRTDTVAISATTFRAIYVALGAGQVRDAGLLATSGHVGDSGANSWNARLCVSRYADGNPTSVAGGLVTIAQRDMTNNNFSANALDANKPWTFGGEVWTDSATYLQPGDVVGILWEKTGAPSNIPTPIIYTTRVEPAPVG